MRSSCFSTNAWINPGAKVLILIFAVFEKRYRHRIHDTFDNEAENNIKYFGNIGYRLLVSISAPKKPYRSISTWNQRKCQLSSVCHKNLVINLYNEIPPYLVISFARWLFFQCMYEDVKQCVQKLVWHIIAQTCNILIHWLMQFDANMILWKKEIIQ